MADNVHKALDIAGFIPGIGSFSEGANSLLYAFQGEKGEAALAALSAIPGIKAVKVLKDGIQYLKIIPESGEAGKALKELYDVEKTAGNTGHVIEGSGKAELGRKLDYIFGNATGSKHNIDRSIAMERQLNSIGIFNNAEGRQLVEKNLIEAFNNPASILKTQENGRVVRESLLSGPNGVIKVESVWDGSKLITATLFGGK